MSRRKAWLAVFLPITAAAVGMECWAGLDSSDDTVPWTDLVVGNVPAPVTLAAIAILTAWLAPHFVDHYRAKGGAMVTAPDPDKDHPTQPLLTRAAAIAGATVIIDSLVGLDIVHVTSKQEVAIVALVGVLAPLVVAAWAHRKVYSPATVARLVAAARLRRQQ